MGQNTQEFIYDFTEEMLEQIMKQALAEGYKIKETIWYDSYEREEGCPSDEYILDDDDISMDEGGELEYALPDDPCNGGCAEWNFVKENEYICFYHIEKGDEYICREAVDAFFQE